MSKEQDVKAAEPKSDQSAPAKNKSAKSWGQTLEDIIAAGVLVFHVTVQMHYQGEYVCVLSSYTEDLARGASKESMQEAVDQAVAALEMSQPKPAATKAA